MYDDSSDKISIPRIKNHLGITQNKPKKRFSELLQKLNELSQCVKSTEMFENFYNLVGLTRKTVLSGLSAIYEYFSILGDQIEKGLILKKVGDRLIEGVHEYLQLQRFEFLEEKHKAIYILEFEIKFSVCLQFFHTIKDQPKDITSEEKYVYPHVWKDIEFVSFGNRLILRKKYDSVKKILILTTTAILAEKQVQSKMLKKILFGLAYPRYYIDYATARLKSLTFYKEPTIQVARSIWDIPELGASKQFMKLAYEKIIFNKKIWIPKDFKQSQFPDILREEDDKIQVRILNYQELHLKSKPQKKKKYLCCFEPIKDHAVEYKQIESVIIHMHGGGFIALSSRMSQIITRPWANHLKIPVFSIDYRKPPKDPFPAALNDCFTVYQFIVKKIQYYMNINPVNIYLAGDSAGGNLACALMGKILKQNAEIPKGIYLAYPALDLRVKFNPSKINAVTDPLLWPSMLLLCLSQYLGGEIENANNPLASPLLLTQQFVGGQKEDRRFPLKWPKTFISAGRLDPLYDDSILLMQKMKQSHIECKCRVYRQLSHGFLNIGFMISQCQKTVLDSIEDIKGLMEKKDKTPKKTKISVSLITKQ